MTRVAGWVSVLACVAAPVAGQLSRSQLPPADSNRVVWLRLADRSEVVGRVFAITDSTLLLRSATGEMVTIPRDAVRVWRTRHRAMADIADEQGSRLFFGPTGRTLSRDAGFIVDHFLFVMTAEYGVHDRVTIGAGTVLFIDPHDAVFYVTPKVSLLRTARINLAVGGIYGDFPGEGGTFGSTYAALTLGDDRLAVTGAVFSGFDANVPGNSPGYFYGGEWRILPEAKVIVEVWHVPEFVDLPTVAGLRLLGDHVTVSVGAWSWRLPYFDIAYNFHGLTR